MARLLWTAPSIGDRVTGISKEPEITKCTPLVWPARTITASTPDDEDDNGLSDGHFYQD